MRRTARRGNGAATATLLDAASDHASENWRVTGHLVIVGAVLVATVVSLSTVVPESPAEPKTAQERTYRVAVPYVDTSLDAYIGRGRLGTRFLMYVVDVRATSPRDAQDRARREFWRADNTSVVPFDGKEKTRYNLSIVDAMIVEEAP